MPQMSPMDWLLIMYYMMMNYIILMVYIYFSMYFMMFKIKIYKKNYGIKKLEMSWY